MVFHFPPGVFHRGVDIPVLFHLSTGAATGCPQEAFPGKIRPGAGADSLSTVSTASTPTAILYPFLSLFREKFSNDRGRRKAGFPQRTPPPPPRERQVNHMKFSCETALLGQAIADVSLAVAQKATLPALEGILLTARRGGLTLVGYNLELGITANLPAKVEEEGEVVIPSRLFSEIVRKTASRELEFSCDSRYLVELRGGVSEFTILGMSALEFPELPSVGDGETVSLPKEKLRSMVDQTLFAVAQNDSKPVHTGCLFLLEEGLATVVAVDGFRLALRREPAQVGKPMRFVVPGRNLSELLKLLGGEEEEEVELQVSRKHILFRIGETTIVSRLLEGEFLDYNSAIPKTTLTEVTVSTRALISSIERTSLLISDRLKSPLRVVFDDGVIKMSCSTTIGKAYDECQCDTQGPKVEMGFNNRYLMDALKNSEADMVKLQISGPLAPMKVVPLEGEDFLFLVLPMKLKPAE